MIIFLDIDGTLSKGKDYVSPRVVEAIRQTRRKGNLVYLCTGRNRIDIESLMYIGFDGAICSGGGYIEADGKEFFHCFNDQESINLAIELFKKNGIYYKLESDYLSFRDDEMLNMFNRFSDDQEAFKKSHHIYPTCEYKGERIQTVYFFGKEEGLKEPQERLKDLFAFHIYSQLDNGYYECELMNKDVDKGKAILKVIEYHHLKIEDSLGFGDSMNDYSMITTVNHGIVMANGNHQLKEYASSICESVEEDGIYFELERRGLL